MSELIDVRDNRATIRWKLLTGASALALTAYVSVTGAAKAEDADHSQLWIELGGQLSRLDNSQENFVPPFFAAISSAGLNSPLKIETPPQYSIDEYGKLSFQPDSSNWAFTAAIRYGRSTNKNRSQQQLEPNSVLLTGIKYPPPTHKSLFVPAFGKFADTQWASSESHSILDFAAGKDVGLGLFGHGGSSQIDVGVRFVQFSSSSKSNVNADPTLEWPSGTLNFYSALKYTVQGDVYWAHSFSERRFHGVGPSISWQGSAPIAGNADSSELAIDWGVNAAALFGRQRASGYHQSSKVHFTNALGGGLHAGAPTHVGPYVTHDRSRSVTVPNIGGSIGLSFRSGNAKVSFGYRADLFMNAMDTGIDARKSSNMLFHGPYASISIGLGD